MCLCEWRTLPVDHFKEITFEISDLKKNMQRKEIRIDTICFNFSLSMEKPKINVLTYHSNDQHRHVFRIFFFLQQHSLKWPDPNLGHLKLSVHWPPIASTM